MARKKKKDSQDSKKKKKSSSVLEYEIMKMMEACMKQAIDTALDSIFKEFK